MKKLLTISLLIIGFISFNLNAQESFLYDEFIDVHQSNFLPETERIQNLHDQILKKLSNQGPVDFFQEWMTEERENYFRLLEFYKLPKEQEQISPKAIQSQSSINRKQYRQLNSCPYPNCAIVAYDKRDIVFHLKRDHNLQ